jgi:hypothetical protein
MQSVSDKGGKQGKHCHLLEASKSLIGTVPAQWR